MAAASSGFIQQPLSPCPDLRGDTTTDSGVQKEGGSAETPTNTALMVLPPAQCPASHPPTGELAAPPQLGGKPLTQSNFLQSDLREQQFS